MSTKRRRRWVRPVVAIATLALIAVFARSVDWGSAWETISNADPRFVALAVAAHLVTLIIKALRWRMFLASVGAPSVSLAVRAMFAGAALNDVVFANGGDAAKVAAVASHARVSSADVLATVAVDKLCDLASYALIFVAVAFALPLPPELARWRTPVLGALALMIVIAAVFGWRMRHPSAPRADEKTGSFGARASAYIRRLVRTLAEVATAPRLSAAFLLALAAWGCQWATFHFAAVGADFPAPAATSLIALLTVNASFVVRLTPGNVGVFQFLYALAATAAGLDRNAAVAVAILISFIQYIPVTTIGLVFASTLVRRGEKQAPAIPQDDIVTLRPSGNREAST
jgi:uncharacterized protein (TIRG00374 family)